MLFSGLQANDFAELLAPIDNLRYAPNTVFYRQDERGENVYSIRRGLVKLVQHLPEGGQRTVRVLGPGAIVGLEALLGHPYRHTVIALQSVDVCRITVATLRQLEARHPWLSERIMAHWEDHLRLADRWISELSSGPVRIRVAGLLLLMLELVGDERATLKLLSYEDMASIVGTSRETFTRAISQLRDEGIVRRAGPARTLQCDVAALQQIA
jgi:CRP-like cAMP-binding protein